MYLDQLIIKANKIIFGYPEALDYLEGRKITKNDILKYKLGYVKVASLKDDGSDDYKFIKEKTADFRTLQGKIIIPLRNLLGNCNGLITRDIKEKIYRQYFLKEAKDLGTFFGLYEALPYIRDTKKVFVHESAMDCISFSKVFPNSISVLTSYMNDVQYETLMFFCKKIILVFNEDKGGKSGAEQVIKNYGDKNIETISIGYNDSNSCLQQLGLEGFTRYINSKVPILLKN